MNRQLLVGLVLFAVVFGGALLVLQQVNGRAAPPPPRINGPLVNKANPAPPRKQAEEPPDPVAPRLPLILSRWKTPAGQPAPDRDGKVTVVIDPDGPTVITNTKTGSVAWNAVTGERKPTARAESGTTIHHVTVDSQWMVQVRDRHTNQVLVTMRQAPTRDACRTPDGRRVIVVGNPSTYPEATYVQIPSGRSHTTPAHRFKNVRLFTIGRDEPFGEFGALENGIDDDIWAVAIAADGQSFFLLNASELVEVRFERAFRVNPIPVQPR